ncbi:uncharacterized protein [Nicotiana sylvestris]|uniref:uncharacterized protein n=1 Tax=Nicotiana sylvestris TaxID=4096 RepID=UPI00388C8BB7
MVEKKFLLKVLPMKGVMRFRKKGKLIPQYIGPFEVLLKIGEVAYKHAFSPSLSSVHPLFHVSMLRKYVGDPSYVLDFSTILLDGDLTYDVHMVAILNRQVQKLRSKDIALVKVQRRAQPVEKATWETEWEMQSRYPHLLRLQMLPWLHSAKAATDCSTRSDKEEELTNKPRAVMKNRKATEVENNLHL